MVPGFENAQQYDDGSLIIQVVVEQDGAVSNGLGQEILISGQTVFGTLEDHSVAADGG